MKIRAVGAELFLTDGQTDEWTDMVKLTVAFRDFANAPKNRFMRYDVFSLCLTQE
jgi:hypothetical protein